jgi:hypothetical protein
MPQKPKSFFLRLAKDTVGVQEGLAWVGWAWTLTPRWIRRPFVQNAIGSFSTWPSLLATLVFLYDGDGPLEGQKVPTCRVALRHYFSRIVKFDNIMTV